VVTRIDRLTRSLRDLQNIVHDLRQRGVTVKATEQSIDTSTAAGECFLDMLGAFAEFETNLRVSGRWKGLSGRRQTGSTVANPLRTRSAIVSSLNPRVSKAFTSRPRGALASTLSIWRCVSVRPWFLGSVAIPAPYHGVDGLPARPCGAIAESFASDCRGANTGKSYPPEIWLAAGNTSE